MQQIKDAITANKVFVLGALVLLFVQFWAGPFAPQGSTVNQTEFTGEHKAWKVSHGQREFREPLSTEVRARAVRLVLENVADYKTRFACIRSISQKIGCSPETLRDWVNKQAVETGDREGLTLPEGADEGTSTRSPRPQASQ